MRVLWFSTNCTKYRPVKAQGRGYNGGGWTSSLQDELVKQNDIQLGVCFCKDGEPEKVEQDGITYYPVPNHRKSKKDKILDIIHYNDLLRDEVVWEQYFKHFRRVISDFKPNVIHVFGSELYIGLSTIIAKEMNIPCVLHIQGLLSLYIYTYFPTGVSNCNYIMKDGLRGLYRNWQYLTYWQRSAYREKCILQAVPHVIGRTHWDKHALDILNPNAKYHYGGEILRPCFYEHSERTIRQKLTITTTSSGATYKGFDLVLKIANILKNECYLDFEWNVYGNVDPKFFEKLIDIKHDDVNIKLCGVASAEELRDAMVESTVYVQPSYTENSPNSVCEAQMLGLPVVATNVGGTSSLLEHGETGFLFPATDPYMGAYYIKKLNDNANLNIEMGNRGKEIAFTRHDKDKIVSDLIRTYKEIIVSL